MSRTSTPWTARPLAGITRAASGCLSPDFYPVASDVGGNYLGVLLDVDLLRAERAPFVLYFHEHDPAYTWVFEDAGKAAMSLRTEARGTRRSVAHSRTT